MQRGGNTDLPGISDLVYLVSFFDRETRWVDQSYVIETGLHLHQGIWQIHIVDVILIGDRRDGW